ncbi:hypothetical protein Gogos_020015, partial [Gossypium gossypioides]|nr:hypothetical protein [Gossypium gossypioides]
MIVKLLLMNMLVILQHQMDWIMLLLHIVEKRKMGMRLRYGTQMNIKAWLGSMKMKNMKMDEHHCLLSFKNKMVTTAMIAQHFEATINDHPKMKLREIQRRCAFEMHVNVTIDCCYRAKKILKEKMAGNHKEEFGLLW